MLDEETMVTRGSKALAKRIGADKKLRRLVAFRCDVSEQAVRNWANGACCPSERYLPLIEEVTGVEAAAWKSPAKGPATEAA